MSSFRREGEDGFLEISDDVADISGATIGWERLGVCFLPTRPKNR